MRVKWNLLWIAFLLIGCRKPPITVTPAPPASRSAIRAAVLQVDAQAISFPAAEAHVRLVGSGISVEISTADGENSLLFDMEFPNLNDASELPGARWAYKVTDEEPDDISNAIYLHQRKVMLDPQDVKIDVKSSDERGMVLELDGLFRLFDPPEVKDPIKVVKVSGEIEAVVR